MPKHVRTNQGEILSGPENIRGIDYQVSASCLLVLDALFGQASTLAHVHFDSLDDESEDLALDFADGASRQIQIKKLSEGYNWTFSNLRPVLTKFAGQPDATEFQFITDGSLGREAIELRQCLAGERELDEELLKSATDSSFEAEHLQSLIGRTAIQSRFHPSIDPANPAAAIREELEAMVLRGPFAVSTPVSETVERVWRIVFDSARAGETLSVDELLQRLASAGLELKADVWATYPTVPDYYSQEHSPSQVSEFLDGGGLLAVVGIGGAGKTTLVAESSSTLAAVDSPVCWVTVDELLEPAQLSQVTAAYCRSIGAVEAAAQIDGAEPHQKVAAIAAAIDASPVRIVLDRLEAANSRLEEFVEALVQQLPSGGRCGSVVVVSRVLPDWWPDVKREKEHVDSLLVRSLSEDASVEFLLSAEIGTDDAERLELARAVARHPQSLRIMHQVRDAHALGELTQHGVDEARDWLVRRVLDDLPDRLAPALARLSVLDYPASRTSAAVAMGPMGAQAMRHLLKRDLIRIQNETVTVHDAIRAAALELLSPSDIEEVHVAVATHLFGELRHTYEETGQLYYETGTLLVRHLEASGASALDGHDLEWVMQADDALLCDLFGISQHGFPYEFVDPTLASTWDRIDPLLAEGLVECVKHEESDPRTLRVFVFTDAVDRYSTFLAVCRCLLHGQLNHLGYVEDFRLNYSYEKQGFCCPWEHCVELQPLPPISDDEFRAWIATLEREAEAASVRADIQTHEVAQARFADAVECLSEGTAGNSGRCPMFGHYCPAGREQATVCRSVDDEEDE